MQGHIVFQKTLPKNKYILIYTTLLYKDQKKTINDAFNNTIFGPEVRPQSHSAKMRKVKTAEYG